MNTGKKTNLVGYFALALVLIALIGIFFEKITGTEFVAILAGIGTFSGIMVNFFTKSHSYETKDFTAGIGDDLGPPDEEEEPV